MPRLLRMITMFVVFPILAFGADIDSTFMKLSRTIIPAFYYSSEEDLEKAGLAIELFQAEWEDFYDAYYNYNWDDEEWKSDFDTIDGFVIEAMDNKDLLENLPDAYVALMDAQRFIRTIRIRNGMENFLDYLIEFQEPLEEMMSIISELDVDTFEETNFIEVKISSSELFSVWDSINNIEIKEEQFDSDEELLESLAESMESLSASLEALKESIIAKEPETIIGNVDGVNEAYFEIYHFLGDFAQIED